MYQCAVYWDREYLEEAIKAARKILKNCVALVFLEDQANIEILATCTKEVGEALKFFRYLFNMKGCEYCGRF